MIFFMGIRHPQSVIYNMKRLLLACRLFASLITHRQNAPGSARVMENYYRIGRMISMRKGKRLFNAVYIPLDSSEKHPILLLRTLYKVLRMTNPILLYSGILITGLPG
jgi:hypothetical protein